MEGELDRFYTDDGEYLNIYVDGKLRESYSIPHKNGERFIERNRQRMVKYGYVNLPIEMVGERTREVDST